MTWLVRVGIDDKPYIKRRVEAPSAFEAGKKVMSGLSHARNLDLISVERMK